MNENYPNLSPLETFDGPISQNIREGKRNITNLE